MLNSESLAIICNDDLNFRKTLNLTNFFFFFLILAFTSHVLIRTQKSDFTAFWILSLRKAHLKLIPDSGALLGYGFLAF